MVLAPLGRLRPTQIIDVNIAVLPTASRGVRTRARVRVHLGAAEVLGRVRLLEDSAEIGPGKSGLAQLRLEAPVLALHGDHFIVRSYSPPATIAGGIVVDPLGVKHRGKEVQKTRKRLHALMSEHRAEKLAAFVEAFAGVGLKRADLAASTGWSDAVLSAVELQTQEKRSVVAAEGVFLTTEDFDRLCRSLLGELAAHHKREPLSRGLPRETLREKIFAHAAPEVFRAVITRLENDGAVVSERDTIRAREHRVDLSEKDTQLRDRLQQVYEESALEAPSVEEAMTRVGVAASERAYGRKILQLLIDSRMILRVEGETFMHARAIEQLRTKLQHYAMAHEPERLIDVAAFKELAGVTRKYAIPLLEYLDRERVTRRAGDKRIILSRRDDG
jgi:selenocysteine-specific elongation factor